LRFIQEHKQKIYKLFLPNKIIMARKKAGKTLTTLLAGAFMGNSLAQVPDMSVNFPKRVLAPGERAYFSVLIDARQFPEGVLGAYGEFHPHPPVITGPITWDIFSSGGDNWGWYIDGFLEGYEVGSFNNFNAQHFDMAIENLDPSPVGRYDEIIRYYFNVDPNAQFGTHPPVRIRYGLIYARGPPFHQLPPTRQQNPEAKNYFTVAPSVQQMADNLNGPNQAISDLRYDRDGDGDMDLRDLAEFQKMYTD